MIVQRISLQRLFSTFANGLPGKGLLALRLILSAYVIQNCFTGDSDGTGLTHLMLRIITGASGMLIVVGLWTPVAGALCSLVELWAAASEPSDPWARVLAAALGAGLAVLGPGAYSVDARAFGRRRISIGNR
jgi:putative oxidoreductase